MNQYRFHERAETELVDAARFYESRTHGLGRSFLAEIDVAISDILRNPESYGKIRGDIRKKLLRRFPYSLLYAIESDFIRIVAVAHHRQRPFFWLARHGG